MVTQSQLGSCVPFLISIASGDQTEVDAASGGGGWMSGSTRGVEGVLILCEFMALGI